MHGYFTANIEYRLSGEAIFPAQVHDCKAAIRYLRAHAEEYRLDPHRIGVWGASAGGCLAALLGTSGGVEALEGSEGFANQSSAVQAVVDLFGPADIASMGDPDKGDFPSAMDHNAADSPESKLLGGPVQQKLEQARAASPLTYVDKSDPPFLIFHGDRDDHVPYSQSVKLCRALQKAGVESSLITVKGGGHGFDDKSDPPNSKVLQMALEFFDRHLKGGSQ
jgi:acetyl esterase/lipase